MSGPYDAFFQPDDVGTNGQTYQSRYGDYTFNERRANTRQGASRGAQTGMQFGGPMGAVIGGAIGGIHGATEAKNLSPYEQELLKELDRLNALRNQDGSFRGFTDEQRRAAIMGSENQLSAAAQQSAALRNQGLAGMAGMGAGADANLIAMADAGMQAARAMSARDLFMADQQRAEQNRAEFFGGVQDLSRYEEERAKQEEEQTAQAKNSWLSFFGDQQSDEGGLMGKIGGGMGGGNDAAQSKELQDSLGVDEATANQLIQSGKSSPEDTADASAFMAPSDAPQGQGGAVTEAEARNLAVIEQLRAKGQLTPEVYVALLNQAGMTPERYQQLISR